MAKAYWVARVDISDADAYGKYIAANAEPFAKYGARFLVRGGDFEEVEGSARQKQVVLEFADYATAMACYNSPEYQAAIKLREAVSIGDLVIVEGYDGPQPGES
ncbi:MAG: DUF1330 domain-containing protein [Alphaproteobacteria bacterium]|jgi:uncharacterized protein (DUF1330 family)|nr:DUF1330 domain-containing protein [Alphaproteobacteria bacterium]MBT4085930.1 DUF1330 domain-containing protein [Alphaproteobacteria bacterium]MBT4542597.1 DUF1330 domain-containing protein [Alphaproteobacteria bacterium]MBT7746801.1 DUF1330 domain-containing protein [Alphaproteobacteria bacterium]